MRLARRWRFFLVWHSLFLHALFHLLRLIGFPVSRIFIHGNIFRRRHFRWPGLLYLLVISFLWRGYFRRRWRGKFDKDRLFVPGVELILGSGGFIYGGRFDKRRLFVPGVRLFFVRGGFFEWGKLDQGGLIWFRSGRSGVFNRGSFFGKNLLFRARLAVSAWRDGCFIALIWLILRNVLSSLSLEFRVRLRSLCGH